MNNNFWTKTTNYKFLGKVLFTKEEICSDITYQGEIYQIQVRKDYFDSEFNLNQDEKKKK